MARGANRGEKVDPMTPEQLNDQTQVLGRQIWRVVPYAKRYPKRVATGIFANAAARFFDLMPFVAIGFAVDYFTGDILSGPQFLQDIIESSPFSPAVFYGILIFSGFFCLNIFKDSINIS